MQHSRISVTAKSFGGATLLIQNVSAVDTILTVKEIIFASNRKMHVRRQQLGYKLSHGIRLLADGETLGGAGLAQDGSAELVMLLDAIPAAEAKKLGRKV